MINYTYRIINTIYAYNTIEIEYSAEGYDKVIVSAPAPTVDKTIDQIAADFLPLQVWGLSQSIEPQNVIDILTIPKLTEAEIDNLPKL